jgi:hypothetical protein
MSALTTNALDLITGALRNINALEAGETPNANDAQDSLQVLNDLLECWSIEKLLVFASTENVVVFVPGQYQYTIGNPIAGTVTGTLVSGSPTISGVTVPANLTVGAALTDVQLAIPSSPITKVLSFNSGAGTITMSANALFNVSTPELITYTQPGDFAYDQVTGNSIQRPVRITNAYTRITTNANQLQYAVSLDYQIRIQTRDKYTAIGLKSLPLPWPTDMYYDPTYPLGTLFFYGSPSMAGQLHLWTDQVLSDFQTLTQPINLPQGYARAIKTNLALELCAEYGKSASPTLVVRAREAKQLIKSLNAIPAVEAFFDQDIVRSRRIDASWIMWGGFNT